MTQPRCAAQNRRGEPCGMAPIEGSDRCFIHSPDQAARRAKARKRGGQRRGVRNLFPLPEKPTSLRDVPAIQDLLERTVHETRAQRNTAQRSRAIGSLLLIALRALEIGELEARLAALEQRLLERPLRRA
jgi:hypothetical protein